MTLEALNKAALKRSAYYYRGYSLFFADVPKGLKSDPLRCRAKAVVIYDRVLNMELKR